MILSFAVGVFSGYASLGKFGYWKNGYLAFENILTLAGEILTAYLKERAFKYRGKQCKLRKQKKMM